MSWRVGVAATATALLVAGCSGDGGSSASISSPVPSERADDRDTYVALGDSFTAAPGVEPQVGGACGRSRINYPNLVAESEGLRLTDVSCSAATSQDLLERQLPAVTTETDLVTVSIGGNDDGLFATLVGSCAAGPCDEQAGDLVTGTLRTIRRNVGEVLAAVAEAAPDARVVVVSYPRLLPADGACPDRVPFPPAAYPFVDQVNRGLVEAQRAAAAEAGVEFADVYAASEGHDICADDAWVNGAETAADGTIPFHPFAVGEAGIAAALEDLLQR